MPSKYSFLALFTALLVACTGTPGGGGNDPDAPRAAATWSKSLGGPGDDWANAVIATRDGGYLAVGVFNHTAIPGDRLGEGTDGDLWAVKLDGLGDTTWQRRLGERATAPNADRSTIRRMRSASDGFWTVGTQWTAGPSGAIDTPDAAVDIVVSRLADDGTVLWSRIYDSGPFTNYSFFENGATAQDSGWDIAPLANGGALVAGWSKGLLRTGPNSGSPGGTAWVARLAEDGTVQWARRLADSPFDSLDEDPVELRVIATTQGDAVVAASTRLRGAADPATTVSLVDSGGALRWTRLYSRFITRDLLQVDDDDERIASDSDFRRQDDDLLLVGDSLSLLFSPFDDADGMLLLVARNDGREVWRQEIEEASSLVAVAQGWRQSGLTAGQYSYFMVAGTGRLDDRGRKAAMAAEVRLDGSLNYTRPYADFEAATSVRLVSIGTSPYDTRFEIIGQRGNTGVRLNVDGGLRLVETAVRDIPSAPGPVRDFDANGPWFERDGTIVGIRGGGSSLVYVVDPNNSLQFSRSFGAGVERRGEQGFDVVEVNDGYVIASSVGRGTDDARGSTAIVKLQPDGAVRWQVRIDQLELTSSAAPSQESLADSADGGVVVAGIRPIDGSKDGVARAVKLDTNGAVVWSSDGLSGFPVGFQTPSLVPFVASVQRLSGGDYLVAGGARAIGDAVVGIVDSPPWITRISPQGNRIWTRLLTIGESMIRVTSMRAVAGDAAVLAGMTEPRGAARVPWAARVAQDGSIDWLRSYESTARESAQHVRIVVAATGGYLLVAPTRDTSSVAGLDQLATSGRFDWLALRLEADGEIRWNRVFGGLWDEFPYGADATADGGFIIAGRSDSLGERAEAWFLRLGADGQVAAGCNAQRTSSAIVNSRAHTVPTAGDTRFVVATDANPLTSRTAALPQQSTGDTALARQCSGVAAPEGGFTPPTRFRLTLDQGSAITPGVVTSAPSGISCGTGAQACTASYFANTTVTLRIDPGAGAYFLGWQGCDQSNDGICLVTMTADRTVTANFRAPDAPSLRVTVVGNGTIAGSGIDCRAGSGSCGATVPAGTILNLAARSDATEDFLGWEEGCAAFDRASPIAVTMTNSRNCTAVFTGAPPGSPRVSVAIEPSNLALVLGNVTSTPTGILCGRDAIDCSQSFAFDTEVRLEASATAPGWQVETLDCQGTGSPRGARVVEFTAVSDVACTARFATDIERLTVQIARDLVGTVGRVYSTGTASPRALDCTSNCERPFTRNSVVELRPDTTNLERATWIGCDFTFTDASAVGQPLVCRVTMDRARQVAAFFTRPNLTGDSVNHLAASFLPGSNGGEVRIRPRLPGRALPCTPAGGACEVVFFPADTAVVDIIQAPGRLLTYHEGCDTLTPPTTTDYAQCRVSMSRNRVVRFSFGGANVAPTARITRTPAGEVAVNQVVSYSAASSTDDQDVGQLSYAWDFDADGVTDATGVTASYAFSSAGVYDISLRVVDAERAATTAVDTITVNPGANTPPVASFVFAPTTPRVGTTVSFDASASSDDGRVTLYEWDFNGDGTFDVSGTPNDARIVTFNYAVAGTYTVRLRVTDDRNATAETTRNVTVVSAGNSSDLTLTIEGGGAGVVTYTPGATACSNETGANRMVCVRQFPTGTQVVLRGFAYSGSRIGEWSGCASVNAAGDECTVALNGNRNVTLFLIR